MLITDLRFIAGDAQLMETDVYGTDKSPWKVSQAQLLLCFYFQT